MCPWSGDITAMGIEVARIRGSGLDADEQPSNGEHCLT